MIETKKCCRDGCNNQFEKPSKWDKKYCSRSCAAIVNNSGINRHKNKESKAIKDSILCANHTCKVVFVAERWKNKKYCSPKCYQSDRKNHTKISVKTKKYCSICKKGISKDAINCRECAINLIKEKKIGFWLSGEWDGSSGPRLLSKTIRNYLLEQANYKCQQCGFDTPHPVDGSTILEIDHINGDGADHRPENLRVLCPNCHALTPTYRARNIGNGRDVYYRRVIREHGDGGVDLAPTV